MKKFDGLLLGCDMDGTLLDSRKQISAKNQEAIWYFVKNGGVFRSQQARATSDRYISHTVAVQCTIHSFEWLTDYGFQPKYNVVCRNASKNGGADGYRFVKFFTIRLRNI